MKNFKKSEVAIYAIALMLVAAGYFNYSTFEQKTQEVYSEDVSQIDQQSANVGDAVLVSNNEVENGANENNLENESTSTTPENTENQTNNQTQSAQNTQDQTQSTTQTNAEPSDTTDC